MDQTNPMPELNSTFEDLECILSTLTVRYLDGPNSAYYVYFQEITPPDSTDIERSFNDLEEGMRSFVLEVLDGPAPFGGVILSDVKGGESFHLSRAVTLTKEELIKAFIDPLLRTLLPLHPSVFDLTETGRSKYEALLKPFWCTGMVALSVKDKWFMLVGEWSD